MHKPHADGGPRGISDDGKDLFGSSGSEASSWSLAGTSPGRGAVDTLAANLSQLQELEWESDEPNARQGEEPGLLPPPGDHAEWVPGEGVRPWISKVRPVGLQKQVLLVNLARSLSRVPRHIMRAMLPYLDPSGLRAGRRYHGVSFTVGALLSCMSPTGMRHIYNTVRANSWRPLTKQVPGRRHQGGNHGDCGEGGGLSPPGHGDEDAGLSVFVNVVRIAVASAVEGRSLLEYGGAPCVHKMKMRKIMFVLCLVACQARQEQDVENRRASL